MQRDPRAWLWDVRDAAAASISEFTAGLDANTYARTPLVHSAVERKFEIIGEALSTPPLLTPPVPVAICADRGSPRLSIQANWLLHDGLGVSWPAL